MFIYTCRCHFNYGDTQIWRMPSPTLGVGTVHQRVWYYITCHISLNSQYIHYIGLSNYTISLKIYLNKNIKVEGADSVLEHRFTSQVLSGINIENLEEIG